MKNGLNTISSIIKGSTPIQIIKKGLTTVYEAFKNLIVSGAFPISLPNSIGRDLVDYKIYGQSIQKSKNIFPTFDTPVEIKSVGDLTNNLIPFPYNNNNGHESNGITYTINTDGSVTANGTATSTSFFYLIRDQANILKSGVEYTISGCTGGSTNTYEIRVIRVQKTGTDYYRTMNTPTTFTFAEGLDMFTVSVCIIIRAGQVVDNLTFYPKIEEGLKATEYEPYGYRIPIISRGKNLIPYPWVSNSDDYFTIKNDGGIEINVDASEKYIDFNFHLSGTLKAGTYIYSGGHKNLLLICGYTNSNNAPQWLTFNLNSPVTISEDINYARMYLQINPNNEVKGTFYIQLEVGTTATEYEPYVEPIITNIYLDEPLRKVGSYADYIDFENKQLVRQMGETAVEISSVLTLSNGNVGGVFNLSTKLRDGNNDGKCERARYDYSYEPDTFYENPGNFILVGDSTDSLDSMKAKYNGSKILYRYAEPIKEIIDLPDIPTFKGTTVIDCNAEVIPSNAEVEYLGKA